MAATKTVFFGTTFAFEQSGVDDVVETFCNGYASNPEDAPFMSYDSKHHVFKIDKLDLHDEDTPMDVLRQLQHYTHTQMAENEIIDPKIRPLEGFIARLSPGYSTGFRAPELLELESGDWDGNPKNTLEAMQHAFTEWKPACGNIKILTEAVAQTIADVTGTEIIPQPAQKMACLFGGNFSLALEKLKNLEPLLNLQYAQRESSTVRRNGNILVTTDTAARPLLGFQKLDFPGCPAYNRVIVPSSLAHSLPRKYVCESRVTQDGRRTPHPNLHPANSTPTLRIGKSCIWKGYTYKEGGTVSNMTPRNAAGSTTRSEVSSVARFPSQKYLDPSKAAELQGWSQAIDTGVDPNEIAPEAPVESTSRRRRRVAVESDDEEDDPPPVGISNGNQAPKNTETLVSGLGTTGASEYQSPKSSPHIPQDGFAASAESFQDDGQLLTGIPAGIHQRQASAAPSTVPSNLMSFTSGIRQTTDGPVCPRSPANPDSIPPLESSRRRKPKATSDSEDDTPVSNQPTSQRDYVSMDTSNLPFVQSKSSPKQADLDWYSQWDDANRTPTEVKPPAKLSSDDPTRESAGDPSDSNRIGMSAARPESDVVHLLPGFEYLVQDASKLRNSREAGPAPNILDIAPSDIDPSVVAAFGQSAAQRPVDEKSKHWENHKLFQGINVDARRQEALSKLQREIEAQEAAATSKQESDETWSTVKGRKNQQKKSRGGPQQRKAAAERSRFHNTMCQGAGNPGKQRGGRKKADTTTDKLKRLEAIEDAYGPTPRASTHSSSSKEPAYSEMSASKKELLATNIHMAYANADARQQDLRIQETESLLTELQPLFEHSRAFSGKLDFGLHFGQVLVPLDPQANKTKSFGSKAWGDVFGPSAGVSGPSTSFTGILTTNGADIDRALDMKPPVGGSARAFDKFSPGPSSVTYEFHCQSKKNESFLIVVQEDLKYEIRNSTATVGKVCIHCPAQVWDGCAILQGAEYWNNPPKEIKAAVDSFVESIYVAPRHELTLYFRQPPGNVVTINRLQMKRVSLHQCLLPGHEDVQLRVAEHTELDTSVAQGDKKLWKAVELGHEELSRAGSLHYEMCLVDTSINAALDANSTLEVGELTDPNETGKSLLDGPRIQRLLELSVTILTRIDFIGLQNRGTMQRIDESRMRREQSLPPGLQSQMHPLKPASGFPLGGLRSGVGSATVPGGSHVATELAKPIHGTRMNTQAEFFQDKTGQLFRRGLGGAIIPVAMGPLDSISEAPVGPDDSASQAGLQRRPANGQYSGMSPGGRGGNPRWGAIDDKPPGFW